MDQVPHSPKIARAQAMDFAFGLSHAEMSVLFALYPTTSEGRAWDKRPREQQKAAMLWVLNRLFFVTFCGFPVGHADLQTRRALLLDWCRDRSTRLQENAGWSMHEVMEWLLEVKESDCWTQKPCGF
jgi:hypothetical protein